MATFAISYGAKNDLCQPGSKLPNIEIYTASACFLIDFDLLTRSWHTNQMETIAKLLQMVDTIFNVKETFLTNIHQLLFTRVPHITFF